MNAVISTKNDKRHSKLTPYRQTNTACGNGAVPAGGVCLSFRLKPLGAFVFATGAAQMRRCTEHTPRAALGSEMRRSTRSRDTKLARVPATLVGGYL